MTTKTLPPTDHLIGTEVWYRHAINRKVTFTEGVKFIADECGAYWLIDEIALTQPYNKSVRNEEFQVWRLRVLGSHGELTCADGNGNIVYRKRITFTDFPQEGITLYFTGNVILLPSEY